MSDNKMIVIGREFSTETRGNINSVFRVGEIDPEVIKEQLNSIGQTLASSLDNIETGLKNYELSELTVKLEVSASGKVAILGNGVSSSGTGGIELKFVKSR